MKFVTTALVTSLIPSPFQSVAAFVPYNLQLKPTQQHAYQHIHSPIFQSTSASDVDSNKEENECPFKTFSMKFPRYRVSVSSSKDDPSYKAKGGGGIFSGIKSSFDKSTVERKYFNLVKSGHFFWIEPKIDVSDDEERVAKGKLGVAASAAVWNVLADTIDMVNKGNNSESIQVAISICNASTSGLAQLIDIINWYSAQQGQHIVAEMDKEVSVPTVILTVTKVHSPELSTITSKHNIMTTEQVIDGTMSWVKTVLVELGICPFTKSVTKSGQGLAEFGVPVGKIAYHHSTSKLDEIPRLMAGEFALQ